MLFTFFPSLSLVSVSQMISAFEAGQILEAYKRASNISAVAKQFKRCRETVRRIVLRGRAPNYTPRPVPHAIALRRLQVKALAAKVSQVGDWRFPTFGSARQIRNELHLRTGKRWSRRTIIRDLRDVGLFPHVRRRVPTRRLKDVAKRRAFAATARRLSTNLLCFSDETWMTCNERTGRIQWTPRGVPALPLERKARWNIPSVMVWGVIGVGYRSKVVILPSRRLDDGELRVFRLDSKAYIRRCLSTCANELRQQGRIFVQDGARAHAAKATREYLDKKQVNWVQNWPPYSPDLNPIESFWKDLADAVGEQCPQTTPQLVEAVKKAWNEMPQWKIDAHVNSFRQRIRDL